MTLPLWGLKLGLETWSRLNFKKQLSNFGETPIWYNSLIRINNKPIYYRSWFSAGISLISHHLGEDSLFWEFDIFKKKFGMKSHFLQYYSVTCAILNLKCKNYCLTTRGVTTDTKNLLVSREFCKLAYRMFLTQSTSAPCKSQEKWLADCKALGFDTIDWSKSYMVAFLCTKESKLRIFQFKLLQCTQEISNQLFSFSKLGLLLMTSALSVKQSQKLSYTFFGTVLLLNLSEMKLVPG